MGIGLPAESTPGCCRFALACSHSCQTHPLTCLYCTHKLWRRAGVALVIATFCNLASPVVTGILFEILTGGQAASNYPKFLGVLATLYVVEPLVTRIYIQNACAAGEKVNFSGYNDRFDVSL